MNKKVHILITGIVQGVYFRYNTMNKASEFGLKGWVRNLRDGRVETVAEGDESQLNRFVEWCGKGPAGSRVKKIDTQWEDWAGEFKTFEIRY
jgi:acylphosphatase